VNANDPWRRSLRRLARNRRGVVGGVMLGLLMAMALLAPVLAPRSPIAADLIHPASPPDAAHLLGSDSLGRDILSRIMHGARISLVVGLSAVALGAAVGTAVGVISGYVGGLLDELVMRAMDVLLAFPTIILAIAIVAALGPSLRNTTVAIGVVLVPSYARLVRGATLSLKQTDFVTAAACLGAGTVRILVRHVLPNTAAVIIVQGSLDIGGAILSEAALSFLGLGAQPPTPSWGSMLNDGRAFIYAAPHIATFPGLAIMLAVLGFNLLGDALRDALDPYMPG